MRKISLFIVFLLMLISNFSNSQSFKKDFVIANENVFNVFFINGDNDIVTLKTQLLSANPVSAHINQIDSNKISSINKQVFKALVTQQIGKLSDNGFLLTNKTEIDATLDRLYDDYTNQLLVQQTAKDETSIKYGRDDYYGLDSTQKDLLMFKLKQLRQLQIEKFAIEKKRFGFDKALVKGKITPINYSIKNTQREIKDLKDYRKFQVSLVGSANVVSSFKIAQQSQINGGFGVIVSKPNHIEFIGAFTISQANDTIVSIGQSSEGFGTSILIPGVRRFSLLTSYRQCQIFPTSYSNFFSKIGIAYNVNITPYNWAIRKVDNSSDSITAKLIPVAMDLMFPFNWVKIYKADQDISISTDIGLTGRYIMGNIGTEKIKQFLGKPNIIYGGLIAGINIKYNGLRFQYHAPLLFGSHVDGLTGGQAYASMTFIATILGGNTINSLFK